MTNTDDTTQDETGRPLCQHCRKREVPESLGTKPRMYCSRNCRQRAYEERKTHQAIEQTVRLALLKERMLRAKAAEAKSRDDVVAPSAKSRDRAESAGAKSRDDAAPARQERPAARQQPRRVGDYFRDMPPGSKLF